ncbi:MAG: LbtU family siderophore porin [gamma proteobacterium symbiont of Bathyaustriella thionipta]|nr:LbtU family siderophore porin [gamma proteobacterium symbiont of Bathyaustriella thionipta]MCU7949346.1 LbtU family siderophore porin [gamma proteobacterium symbiont of Bathyaustriella thionipta]MCU7952652.1 LbtU family siderophore porin [gamma proteobacterium symbiont of Bathyaustriella thionipta]MCU7955529.1 LbtU family siderophore porin [gamma proteobacterium symbiont of Bathyaustriella thionipta]MCU7968581.1 LbtU family siderophore porin [gamma proteobacterium symbiont of Bathyaustriella
MKLKVIILVCFCAFFHSPLAFSDAISVLKAQLTMMQQQMQVMQDKLDAQEAVLKKQQQVTQAITQQQPVSVKDQTVKSVTHGIANSMTIAGLVEVIAHNTSSDGWSGETASDLILDTFELSLDASASDWASAHVLFLYEDDDNDHLNVDEAFIRFANADVTPFYLTAGRLYVPFGSFGSHMISDPVTLTLGETREDAVQLGFAADNGFYGSAYVFNGDIGEAKNDYSDTNNKIDNYGLNLGYSFTFASDTTPFVLDTGAAYINNIATSDTLDDVVNTRCAGDACIKDYVPGLSLYASAYYGQFSLFAEYVTALDDFKMNELTDINNKTLKPGAWNLEGAYHFELVGKQSIIALGYQKTQDLYFDTESTDFFEKAWLVSFSVAIIDNTTLSVEWKHSDGYDEVKKQRRSDADKFDDENLMQLKLSYEF